jgi:hypothetical protein
MSEAIHVPEQGTAHVSHSLNHTIATFNLLFCSVCFNKNIAGQA